MEYLISIHIPLEESDVVLKTYSSERLKTMGKKEVKVGYKAQEKKLVLYVIEGAGPSLLGREWLAELRLEWPEIVKVLAVKELMRKENHQHLDPCFLNSMMCLLTRLRS